MANITVKRSVAILQEVRDRLAIIKEVRTRLAVITRSEKQPDNYYKK